jgi:hypothetical protein
MDTSKFAMNVSQPLVVGGFALSLMTAAGCQPSATEENTKGVTIETDRGSGSVDIDVDARGRKIKVDAGKDGADVRF